MKTYAPKGLWGGDLRRLLEEMHASQADACKFLQVGERTLRRWLADNSAPFAVLAALWHETPTGRHQTALDVGNELAIHRGLAAANGQALATESARLARLVAISDTGAANDPLSSGPYCSNTLTGPGPSYRLPTPTIDTANQPSGEKLEGLKGLTM